MRYRVTRASGSNTPVETGATVALVGVFGYCAIDICRLPTQRGSVRRTCHGNCLDKYALTLRCGEIFTQPCVFDFEN